MFFHFKIIINCLVRLVLSSFEYLSYGSAVYGAFKCHLKNIRGNRFKPVATDSN